MAKIVNIKKLLHLLMMVLEHIFPRMQGFFGVAEDTPWVREFDKIFDANFMMWAGGQIPSPEGRRQWRELRKRWAERAPHGANDWSMWLPIYRKSLQTTVEWSSLQDMYGQWKAKQRSMATDATWEDMK